MKGFHPMNRREALKALLIALTPSSVIAAKPAVSTPFGTGSPGYSDQEVNDPFGLLIGPDRALCFCDLGNQRIRRLDLETHRTRSVVGNGQKAYSGDGGSATDASVNMPHEIQFDSAGNLYIVERYGFMSPVCQQTRTVGGAGPTPRIDCTRGASAARDQ